MSFASLRPSEHTGSCTDSLRGARMARADVTKFIRGYVTVNLCECLRIGCESLRIFVYFIADPCICPRTCAYLCELARVLPRICRECGDPTAYFRELARTLRIRVFAVYPRISTYIRGVSAVYSCILIRVSSAYLPYIRRESMRNMRVFAYELGHVSHEL